MQKQYVVGFAFDNNRERVALILKQRPNWQRGRLNGVGGKVEPGEKFLDAMVREFQEETGYVTKSEDWDHIHTLDASNSFIRVYRIDLPTLNTLQSMTDEDIVVVRADDFNTLYKKGVPNILWLVHNARRANIVHGYTLWTSDGTTADATVDNPIVTV